MSEGVLPPKRDVADALLRKGSLFVHLDPRAAGVSVPAWLKDQPQLVLQVGFDMVIRIPDLLVDEDGVYGTLSFSRSPFACIIPWNAVFALVGDDGRGLVWPESMPPEIAAEVDRESQRARRSVEDRLRPVTPLREVSSQSATSQPSAAAASAGLSEDVSLASLVNTKHADLPALKPDSTARSKGGRILPPYLRVVK